MLLPGSISALPIVWAGKVLNPESKVAVKLVFNPAAYTGELSAPNLRISYETYMSQSARAFSKSENGIRIGT